MNLEQYTKINNFFIRHSTAFSLLLTANRLLTACGFLLYPLLLLCLLTKKNIAMLISFIAIPALCFLAVTIFRKVVNKKRPYEKLPIQSLIKKDKKGQSFPSRHVFSIFLIATLWFCFWKPVGIFLFIAGVFLAIVSIQCHPQREPGDQGRLCVRPQGLLYPAGKESGKVHTG